MRRAHNTAGMTIGLAAMLVISLCGAAAEEQASQFVKPWFCHDLDCPPYKLLNSTPAYEVRKYAAGKYSNTKTQDYLYAQGIGIGFQRLFKYISGENEADKKIAMTSPVITRVLPGDGPFCKSNFSMHFYLPYKDQADPPKPTNPLVNIESAGSETFFVSQFGGFLLDDFTLASKAATLREALVADGEDYEDGVFFTAGYDPPFRLQHRHNEIWILKTSKSASATGTAAAAHA